MISALQDCTETDTLRDALAASIDALTRALRQDLPDMIDLHVESPHADEINAMPQDLRRDFHAARCMYGIRLGAASDVKRRRPFIDEVQSSLSLGANGAYRFVVLCVNGAAAMYRIEGAVAVLDGVVASVADAKRINP